MKVLAGIISWDTKDLLAQCVESIRKAVDDVDLMVVDNGSKDGSREWALANTDRPLLFPKNRGYTVAANRILERAVSEGYDYAALVNTDIIVSDGWVERMVELSEQGKVAVVVPKLLAQEGIGFGAGGAILDLKWPISTEVAWDIKEKGVGVVAKQVLRECPYTFVAREGIAPRGDFPNSEAIPHTPFPCVLVSTQFAKDCGFLDENYHSYKSDTEYCLRAWQNGWEVWYCSETYVTHLGSEATFRNADRDLIDRLISDDIRFAQECRKYDEVIREWLPD